jgi:hypothetical protein
MTLRICRSIAAPAARFRARKRFAALALASILLALGQPLLTHGLEGVGPFCCRSGRCCCDSGEASPARPDLEAACRCARPDGAALAVALPRGVLPASGSLAPPSPGEAVAPPPAPAPREAELPPPDQPPRPSRAT